MQKEVKKVLDGFAGCWPYLAHNFLLPTSKLLSPCVPATLLSSLSLEYAKLIPASGPLHKLFLLILQLPAFFLSIFFF